MEEDLRGLEIIEEQCQSKEASHILDTPTLKSTFSQKIKTIKKCENILIIDGDYFEIGIKEMEKANSSRLCLSNPDNLERLISFIESKTGISHFDWKSFHSAEEPKSK